MTRELAADLRAATRLLVEPKTASAPDGTRTGLGHEIGKLAMTGIFSTATVTAVASVLRTWLTKRKAGQITVRRGDVEIIIAGATEDQVSETLNRLPALLTTSEDPISRDI